MYNCQQRCKVAATINKVCSAIRFRKKNIKCKNFVQLSESFLRHKNTKQKIKNVYWNFGCENNFDL